jgi:hypothetical protein
MKRQMLTGHDSIYTLVRKVRVQCSQGCWWGRARWAARRCHSPLPSSSPHSRHTHASSSCSTCEYGTLHVVFVFNERRVYVETLIDIGVHCIPPPQVTLCSNVGGSGSGGSICFWASWIWIRICKSEVRIRIQLWIRILLSSSKNSKKSLDSYCFATSL